MKFVDLKAQHDELQPELNLAISRVIEDSSFIRGPDVVEFETRFAKAIGVKHCISCGNGTDALYIAQKALGAGPGDEVITPSHTWISTSETITQTGATPIFVDTEPRYFTLCPNDLVRKITPRTKGVIVVHLYGLPANMTEIRNICDAQGLWLIEDCAQAHFAEFEGQTVGTFGDLGTFSFYPGKNLGAMGDAGAVVTNRDDLSEFVTSFARHGGKGNHTIEGICSRMDGIQAAVLNLKLTHIDRWTEARIAAAERYDLLFEDMDNVETPEVRPGCRHVFHLYVIRIDHRDALKAYLAEHGIPTGIHYTRALPFYDAYKYLKHQPNDFPVSEKDAMRILSLPLHPHITEDEQAHVVDTIKGYFARA
ncbi:MAG: DegT/DnrJ/EryC1/StrS family aminotransferase [Pseudomonadota bacterium]